MSVRTTKGQITEATTGAIVNAANSGLREGSGVCGAIFGAVRLAGGHGAHRQLTDACNRLAPCAEGGAVITPSFGLDASWIIHAVGPRWPGADPAEVLTPAQVACAGVLEATYVSILRVCRENSIGSVTIPAISTGVFGFPKDLGAAIARRTCGQHGEGIDVDLVAYDDRSFSLMTGPESGRVLAWMAQV
jgi:O-acetyl-ADP-ribose deacetylase (regulator of RNase III)